MLDPNALPIPKPGFPCTAATPETNISGAEVPRPIITMPTISGEISMFRAMLEAPSTNWSALQISKTKPTRIAAEKVSIVFVGFRKRAIIQKLLHAHPPSFT